MELKDRVKILRNDLGMSATELAEKLNKSESAIRMWESGKSKPDADTLIELTKMFNCSSDYLLGLTNSANNTDIEKLQFLTDTINKSFSELDNDLKKSILNSVNAMIAEYKVFTKTTMSVTLWTESLELIEKIWALVYAANKFIAEQSNIKENEDVFVSLNGLNRILLSAHNLNVVINSIVDALLHALVDSIQDNNIRSCVVEEIYNSTGKRLITDNITETFWELYGKR